MLLTIGQASNMMGVSITTLRRWDKMGTFTPCIRTQGGHRRYSISNVKRFLGEYINDSKRKIIAYARVSSHDQKEDLKRQVDRLNLHCNKNYKTYEFQSQLQASVDRGDLAGFHELRYREIDGQLWIDFHALVPAGIPVDEAHQRVTEVEHTIVEALPQTQVRISSHIEPAEKHGAHHPHGHDGTDPFHPLSAEDTRSE